MGRKGVKRVNVFRLHRGYRKVGVNYGLPVWYVDVGPGVSYTAEELLKKLINMGMKRGDWVVVRNNPIKEKGIGYFVGGLNYIGVRVEVEDNGMSRTPGWFPKVDRWLVEYVEGGVFNYRALRNNVDMLLYKGSDVEEFLEKTRDLQALKGVLVDDVACVWEAVKNHNVRVYQSGGE